MEMKMIRSIPAEGRFFEESTVETGTEWTTTENAVINIFDEIERQEILGFGGAFTEAAAYNYAQLTEEQKDAFMKAYFDKKNGIGYNFGRTHINSCDFSLDIYTYVKDGDKTLESFDISRDKKYIIPFLRDAMRYCDEEIVLFASPWSPPAYMKDNGSPIKGGKLLEEYKELWARYYAKYIKAFAAEGIKIGALSVQNEPHAVQTWESCVYNADDEREFLEKYLIPVLDEEGLSDIKIIIWDHNKERVYDHAKAVLSSPKVNARVWAVGHHWYSGEHFEGPRLVHEVLHKPTICSEFCESSPYERAGNSVGFAEHYAREIAENFNNYNIAMCDWNLLLNEFGGPFHNRSAESSAVAGIVFENKKGGCYAPIVYDTRVGELVFTPTYYYIGHFSKFVKRGAKCVAYTKYTSKLTVSAFKNPDGTRAVIVMNPTGDDLPAKLRHDGICTRVDMPAHSITTLVF